MSVGLCIACVLHVCAMCTACVLHALCYDILKYMKRASGKRTGSSGLAGGRAVWEGDKKHSTAVRRCGDNIPSNPKRFLTSFLLIMIPKLQVCGD